MIGSVELQSRKIRKRSKKSINDPQNFVCGNCNRSYKFYPGLYLHIRNKHEGIRPPGTTIIKPERKVPDIEVKSGRPIKGKSHIDELDEAHADIETACNELMRLLGEKLQIIMSLGPKNSLESVVLTVLEACQENTDKWLKDIEEESKNFLLEYQEKDLKMRNLDFEEEFMQMKRQETKKVLVWFLMWLGKVYVKSEFVPNLCVIFSRIWKVMEETQIEIQDLDNKLVWKKILQECDKQRSRLPIFKDDPDLLIELIKKVCQLIGKVFEEK